MSPPFDDRFESFLERASGGCDVIPLRSVEYLDWRFCDPRVGRFVVRAAEEGSELVDYSVVHAIGSRGHIVDLLAARLDDRSEFWRMPDQLAEARQPRK